MPSTNTQLSAWRCKPPISCAATSTTSVSSGSALRQNNQTKGSNSLDLQLVIADFTTKDNFALRRGVRAQNLSRNLRLIR